MIRLLNVLALLAVISSATWAYSVKYETILVAEKLRKRETELNREKDAVAILQAEWHLLNRPERLAALAKPEAGMQTVSAKQIVRPSDIPQATPDHADKIDALLTGSIPTPDSAKKNPVKSAGTTPPATPKAGPAAKPGQSAKATTPKATTPKAPGASTTAAARTPDRTAKANAPIRLTPPAKVGAAPKAAPAVAAAPAPEARPSGGLSGFLKKLIQ